MMRGMAAHLGKHLIQAKGVGLCRVGLKLDRPAAAVLCAVVHSLEALHRIPCAHHLTRLYLYSNMQP